MEHFTFRNGENSGSKLFSLRAVSLNGTGKRYFNSGRSLEYLCNVNCFYTMVISVLKSSPSFDSVQFSLPLCVLACWGLCELVYWVLCLYEYQLFLYTMVFYLF